MSRSDQWGLTPRRLKVLQAFADGGTYPTVARALGITEKTVERHLLLSREALRAVNTTHAVAAAMRKGLIE